MTVLPAAARSDTPRLADAMHDRTQTLPWMPKLHSHAGTGRVLSRLFPTTEITVTGGAPIAGFVVLDGGDSPASHPAQGARGQGNGSGPIERARRIYQRHRVREITWTVGNTNDEKMPDVRLDWRRP